MATEPAPAPAIPMLRGVVAMIDALGFKGIWGQDPENPSTEVLETLRRIGEAAEATGSEAKVYLEKGNLPEEVVRLVKEPDVKVVQLSDTIVVAAGRRMRARALWGRHVAELEEQLGFDPALLDGVVDGYMRYLVCRCVSRILRTAALCTPALTYRGVVTCGMFAIDQRFLLGPAVDEAANLLNLADGPFVWLAPTARGLSNDIVEQDAVPWETIVVRYDVPLKGGQQLRTGVVNPFAFCADRHERLQIGRKIIGAMESNNIDVVIKRGNARKFLKEAVRRQVRNEERRARKARDMAAYLAAATGETVPAGEPLQVVAPAQSAPPAATDNAPTIPGQPPPEPTE